MTPKKILLVGVAATTVSWAAAASAQDVGPAPSTAAPDEAAQAEQEIVVTGIRASMQSAQARKQNATQIVDSIVAEDIGKLPDVNVTEALQRISGVQVARDRGEGGSVAIRGLSQVLVTLNAREIFTAGGGRSFNLQDYPAELLAGLDVYKSPSANLIEGGIGGTIDLRTRKPLDFDGFFASASVLGRYSDLIEKVKPMVSGLVSTRWNAGDGEMGLLLSGAYQERAYRSDVDGVGNPQPRNSTTFLPCTATGATACTPAGTISLPNGTYEPLIAGNRTRLGLDGTFQWRVNPELEFYAQASYQRFKDRADQWGLNKNIGATVPTQVTLFDGTSDVATATFQNLLVQSFAAARDVIDQNEQYAVGGSYKGDGVKLSAEVTYQKSTNDLYYTDLSLRTTVPTARFDISGDYPVFALSGSDLTNVANYQIGAATRNENHYEGDQYAGRFDVEFDIESPFLSGVNIGGRWARRSIDFQPIRFFNSTRQGQAASQTAGLFSPARYWGESFYKQDSLATDFLTVDISQLRDRFDGMLTDLGITGRPAVTPLGIYDMSEETGAGYIMGEFRTEGALSLDGNVGLRLVQTNLNVNGNQPVYTQSVGGAFVQTGIAPINLDNEYLSVLPSANVRIGIADGLQLRLAAAKTLTRPDFSQLAPSLTLVPGQQAGSSGNPGLRPLRSDQFDASLEYYASPTTNLYVAGFYRKVKDFILTQATPNVEISGIIYTLTRPTNLEQGTIKGLEAGGQTFFDFLPAPFDGFGVQANYTFVDSDTPSAIAGYRTPLPQLSKHSFNLVGLYEKGPLSARIAYNHRSKFLTGVFAAGTFPVMPTYRKGYGWLDASINYDLTKQITLTLEGSNLQRTPEEIYYNVETRPGNQSIDDRQLLFGIRFKL
jgi:TonB-dependent receptor